METVINWILTGVSVAAIGAAAACFVVTVLNIRKSKKADKRLCGALNQHSATLHTLDDTLRRTTESLSQRTDTAKELTDAVEQHDSDTPLFPPQVGDRWVRECRSDDV